MTTKYTPILLILTSFLLLSFTATHKQAYQIFDKKGKVSSYKKMLQAAKKADVILFGELHNNPICHWLQLELTKDLHAHKQNQLVLGAEMFEADNQLLINEYLQDLISEKSFEKEARLWPNYKTDYKPLLSYAKANNLPFIASNIPRRYASMVYKKGLSSLDSLSEQAKKYIAPLPIEVDLSLPNYQSLLEMAGHSDPNPSHFPHSQAVKDATMAYFIVQTCTNRTQFLHFNGAYHSNNFEGIFWHLKQQKKQLKILTISSVEQVSISLLDKEFIDLADFVITIPESMTKTY